MSTTPSRFLLLPLGAFGSSRCPSTPSTQRCLSHLPHLLSLRQLPVSTVPTRPTQFATPASPPPPSPPPLSQSPAELFATLAEKTAIGSPQVWFSRSTSSSSPLDFNANHPPNPSQAQKVKLGRTLRVLQDRLPTLLQSPLPQDVLAPNITLHLFPSTHPHLPTVTGRVAYIAALWTSPIAWNRVPLIGNVKLEILSERIVRDPSPRHPGALPDRLMVRWRSIGRTLHWDLPFMRDKSADSRRSGSNQTTDSNSDKIAPNRSARADSESASDGEFTGLFIFAFDLQGRILIHTIEHVHESGQWEQGVGAKVVGLTDWLLGGMKGSAGAAGSDTPCPAFCRKR